jgi:IS4 transposase
MTRRVTDDLIEFGDTGEVFRRVTIEDADGDVTEYLTTLSAEQYDPVDVVSIYTLRWLIEILIREMTQYTNIQNFLANRSTARSSNWSIR